MEKGPEEVSGVGITCTTSGEENEMSHLSQAPVMTDWSVPIPARAAFLSASHVCATTCGRTKIFIIQKKEP